MNAEEKFLIDVGLFALIIIIGGVGSEMAQTAIMEARADQPSNDGPDLAGSSGDGGKVGARLSC
jgi:hypothetical protein